MMRDLGLIAQAQKKKQKDRFAVRGKNRTTTVNDGEKTMEGVGNRRVYKKRQRKIKAKPLVQ